VVESLQGCGVCAECKRDNVPACNESRQIGVGGADGGYAEFFVASARCTHKVPPGVSLSQAALCEPLAIVIKGLRRLGSSAADATRRRCAVVGGGTVGYLTAKVLMMRGHEVTVFDDAARLRWFADPIRTEKELANLERFDWLIDASGERDTLATLLQRSASGATLLLLGSSSGSYQLSFDSRTGIDKSVIGSTGSGNADFKEALATLPMLDVAAMTDVAYPLEQFATAWTAARSQTYLKVMLRMDVSTT
jgi:threonine dehydrogenase-like Zn-dependent dehydrogenase